VGRGFISQSNQVFLAILALMAAGLEGLSKPYGVPSLSCIAGRDVLGTFLLLSDRPAAV
jgi:hypothetical protein